MPQTDRQKLRSRIRRYGRALARTDVTGELGPPHPAQPDPLQDPEHRDEVGNS